MPLDERARQARGAQEEQASSKDAIRWRPSLLARSFREGTRFTFIVTQKLLEHSELERSSDMGVEALFPPSGFGRIPHLLVSL